MPKQMRCCDCRFWLGGEETEGQCRRHAPRSGEKIFAHWPTTGEDDFCGEFDRGASGAEDEVLAVMQSTASWLEALECPQ